jgi:hypothetical protein
MQRGKEDTDALFLKCAGTNAGAHFSNPAHCRSSAQTHALGASAVRRHANSQRTNFVVSIMNLRRIQLPGIILTEWQSPEEASTFAKMFRF